MSTFAKASFDSARYEAFRPRYPKSFYAILKAYMGKSKVDTTLDLGCGTGVASFPLVELSDKVTAIDISGKMIETANKVKKERLADHGIDDQSRIAFKVNSVNNLEEPAGSYDLITAAQCIHWFGNFKSFFAAAHSLLKPKGTLAYWYYADPFLVDCKGPCETERLDGDITEAARRIYHRFVYEDPEGLGPHWDQPGRGILKEFLAEVDNSIPHDMFENVVVTKFIPTAGNYGDNDLRIFQEDANLLSLAKYISTYSAFHRYSEVTGKGEEFIENFIRAFEDELGFEREKTTFGLRWSAGYTFLTKK